MSRVVGWLSRRLGELASYGYLLCVVFIAIELVSDRVFRRPTVWVHDATITLAAIGFLFGGAYAQVRNLHIRITTLHQHFSPRVQRLCEAITLALTLIFLGFFAIKAGQQAYESVTVGETSGRAWDSPMPMVIRSAFFLATLLLFAQVATDLGRLLRRGRSAP